MAIVLGRLRIVLRLNPEIIIGLTKSKKSIKHTQNQKVIDALKRR